MNRVIDGKQVEAETLPPLPRGAPGVFETVLLLDSVPVFWSEHATRFDAGCRWFGLTLPVSFEVLRGVALDLARLNQIRTGVVRYAAWRDQDGQCHWQVDAEPPRPHMLRAEYRVSLTTGVPAATPADRHKHLDREFWMSALGSARAAGFDEVILARSDGELVEGAVSNVFLVADGNLHTPYLASGALSGVMRGQVIAVARACGYTVQERRCTEGDLISASEIWLTNSLIGIRPVVAFAGRELAGRQPVLDSLRQAWRCQHGWDALFRPGENR